MNETVPGSGRGWHPGSDALHRYVSGAPLAAAQAMSVEVHTLGCEQCRIELAVMYRQVGWSGAGGASQDMNPVDVAWMRIRSAIETPPSTPAVRVLRRLGLNDSDATLLSAVRSLSAAWSTATVLMLSFAAVAVIVSPSLGVLVFLLIAPLTPVLGVAMAFGASGDPLFGLAAATPYPAVRLVMLRSLAVAATSVPLAVVLGFALPGPAWLAAAWLAPAVALTLVVLVASTWTEPLHVTIAVLIGWAAVVAAAAANGDVLAVVSGPAVAFLLVLALAALVVLSLRLRSLHLPGGHA